MDEIIGETIALREELLSHLSLFDDITEVPTNSLRKLLDNADKIITYINYLKDNELILGEGK